MLRLTLEPALVIVALLLLLCFSELTADLRRASLPPALLLLSFLMRLLLELLGPEICVAIGYLLHVIDGDDVVAILFHMVAGDPPPALPARLHAFAYLLLKLLVLLLAIHP